MPEFFSWWVITHFLNIFFMLLLFRSGIEVLSAFPKFYWHDDCQPGREWLRLSKKVFGADSRKPWSSPGPGRHWHWHFMTIQFWILTGAVYISLVFGTGYWRRAQRLLGFMVDPFERVISRLFTSREHFRRSDISPYHRVNGYPPVGEEYEAPAAGDFLDYRLSVGGLVEHRVNLSLAELRSPGNQHQITRHNCIQGWTAIAEWAGVPLARLIEEARPSRSARHVVFYAMDDKGLTEGEGRYGFCYGTIPIHLATNPQTILALT